MPRPKKIRVKHHERTWGEGTVKEVQPGVWRAWRARVHGADGASTRPSRTFKGEGAEAKAANWARGIQPTAVMHLGQWLEQWYALKLPIIRPPTQRNYRRHVKACAPLFLRPLAEISPEEWQGLTNQLLRRWSRGGVDAWKGIISSALGAAVPRYLTYNPMLSVKLPRATEQPVKAWNTKETQALVAAAAGRRHEAWLWLSLGTGIRLGESRSLRWTDVDFESKTILVSKSVDYLTDVEGPTKSGRVRTVDLPDEVIPVLLAHRARQRLRETYVIGQRKAGGPHDPVTLRAWLLRMCKRAGATPFSPHSTRHTFATLSLEAGVPLKEVSEALGHANVATTARIYSHAVEQRRRRAANAMGAVLSPRPGTKKGLKLVVGTANGSQSEV